MTCFTKAGSAKTKVRRVYADLTKGICQPQNKTKNSVGDIMNFSSDKYPWLATRERLKNKYYNGDFTNGCGAYDQKVYFIKGGKFYFNRTEKFEVSAGKKKFCNYNGKIIIFPDMIYYNPETDEHGSFGITTDEITYKISNRTVGAVDFGLSSIHSDEVNLTDYFKVGDGIKITDEEGLGISGFHTITAVNKEEGTLFFDKFEFGDGEGFVLSGKLSHGAPQSCDAACICGGRVWVAGDNKIQASTINDECNWAVGGDDEKSSFVCDFDNGETITACIEFEGSPVFFSEKKIYKVYGDRASNFYLKCCSNWGGIPENMSGTIAVLKDKIFYVSVHGITYFDGSTPKILDNVPFSLTGDVFAASDGEKYYVYSSDNNPFFFVYDERNNQWYKYGEHQLTAFFVYNGALYGCTWNAMYSLWGDSDLFIQYGLEDIPYHSVDFSLDMDGSSPHKVVLDIESAEDADYEIYVSYDADGERTLIKTVRGASSGKSEMLLLPRRCSNLTVGLGGEGSITIRELYVDVVD